MPILKMRGLATPTNAAMLVVGLLTVSTPAISRHTHRSSHKQGGRSVRIRIAPDAHTPVIIAGAEKEFDILRV